MNIVVVKVSDINKLPYGHQATIREAYKKLITLLGSSGKNILMDVHGYSACFLIPSKGLLSSLANADSLHQEILIQVFSLTSPEEQLLGTVTVNNQGDDQSYVLKFSDQG